MAIDWTKLEAAARDAARLSYSPYSHYPVGAALLTEDGEIVTGCNIENASYGLTNCAERTAVFKAVSAGRRKFAALVVAGGTDTPAYPCGACRQVLSEFCTADMPVHIITLADAPDKTVATTMDGLLPYSFAL